jgi:hypothetical protein
MGQREAMENAASVLKAIDRAMVLFCARRMGMDPDALEAKVSGGREWWFGVEEAAQVSAIDLEVQSVGQAVNIVSTMEITQPATDGGMP